MKQNKILSLVLVIAGLISFMPALAGPITVTQSQDFNLGALDDSTSFSFNGFDSSLGILNSVHLKWTMDQTLDNYVINTTASDKSVGTPNKLTATSTTTFSGSGAAILLTDVNTLTTPEFAGIVPKRQGGGGTFSYTTVSTASKANFGGKCLSNDNSCGDGNTSLDGYIGGLNLFNIALSYTGNQTGSVPSGLAAGYEGYASGTVSLTYDYSIPLPATGPTPTPEPASFSLLGLGLAGFVAFCRRKSICFPAPKL